MKYKLLSVALLVITSFSFAQHKDSYWKSSTRSNVTLLESRMQLPEKTLLDLDLTSLKAVLINSPQRNSITKAATVVLTLPDADGQMERFRVYENSNMDPALAILS